MKASKKITLPKPRRKPGPKPKAKTAKFKMKQCTFPPDQYAFLCLELNASKYLQNLIAKDQRFIDYQEAKN